METDLSSLSASEVASTEDSVTAFLEVLVDPVLPLKASGKETPSVEKQQIVAKQMHAVVVLYNYYQRKLHPELEFLSFELFCKLVLDLRPSISSHMKFMHQSDHTVSDDLENQLSITELAIMDACKLCLALDVSKDVPVIEEWPISKVTIFLTDSSRNNCAVVFGSVTEGVWSVIEKGIDICEVGSGSGSTIAGNKRKRSSKNNLWEGHGGHEARYRKIAYSAVKEATGINRSELKVLESHVVYSLSKEKTAACFYIVRCKSLNPEKPQVPIKDAIKSLEGPLVIKISGTWAVTPVVEYFHLLPYTEILSKWFSREASCAEDLGMDSSSSTSKEASGASTGSPKQKDSNGCDMVGPTCYLSTAHNVGIDETSPLSTQREDQTKNARMAGKVYRHHKRTRRTSSREKDVAPSTVSEKKETTDIALMESEDQKVGTENKISITRSSSQDKITVGDQTYIASLMDVEPLQKVQSVLAAKEQEISLAAIRVLARKREILTQRIRYYGDEIALCDRKINAILDGGKDNLALNLETLLDFCNDICAGGNTHAQESTLQTPKDYLLDHEVKGKRLSEAAITFRTPVEELDNVCRVNGWVLPTYGISPSDGGYVAHVALKGLDFDWSCYGDMRSVAHEARDSAATAMLVKLQNACPTK